MPDEMEVSLRPEGTGQTTGARLWLWNEDRGWRWLLVVLAGAFALRFGLALLSPNISRPDEVFQNLEPAFRMWSGHGVVTWDWREGIRSPMFPGFLAGLMKISSALGLGARGYLAVIAAVLSLISLSVVAVGYLVGWRQWGRQGAIVCGVLCAAWPDLVYFGPKPLGEVQSGNLLIAAVYLAAYARSAREESADASVARWAVARRMFVVGVLLGLVFVLRLPLSPAVLLVAVWTCRGQFKRLWLPLVAGALVPVLAMGLIDYVQWGRLFYTVWRNYDMNIHQHVAAQYGVSPVYAYLSSFVSFWRLSAVVILGTFLLGVRRAPLLTGVAMAVLVTHSLIAHKEFNFIYAALPPLLIVAGLGTVDLMRWWQRRGMAVGLTVGVGVACWICLSLQTALSRHFRPRWTTEEAALKAESALRGEPALCGLGLRSPEVPWYYTGGDVYLGRGIPLYAFETPAGAEHVGTAMNFILGGSDVAQGLPGYALQRCWTGGGTVCVARAVPARGCVANERLDLNSVPRLGGPGKEAASDPLVR